MESIRYFTILGERCSGTHFVQHALLTNFHIQYIKGEKHFFGNREFRNTLDVSTEQLSLHEKHMFEIDKIPADELLTICLVREPVEWIDSFFKRKHHVPPENKEPIEQFLSCVFYSVYEEPPKKHAEIMEDRNWKTKERYTNIFELRRTKCEYLLDHIPKISKHYLFLRYEDLRDNYENTLENIQNQFQLWKKNDTYTQIHKYKGTFNALYEKKPILLEEQIREYIWENVDREQEATMGYKRSDR